MFVKPEVRKSLLARMLNELLDTRAMVKKAMKDYRDDSVSKLVSFFLYNNIDTLSIRIASSYRV